MYTYILNFSRVHAKYDKDSEEMKGKIQKKEGEREREKLIPHENNQWRFCDCVGCSVLRTLRTIQFDNGIMLQCVLNLTMRNKSAKALL